MLNQQPLHIALHACGSAVRSVGGIKSGRVGVELLGELVHCRVDRLGGHVNGQLCEERPRLGRKVLQRAAQESKRRAGGRHEGMSSSRLSLYCPDCVE